jgi:hypothetical protein
VPENLARIFREIAPRERVEINVPNGNYERIVRQQLAGARVPAEEHLLSSHQDQRELVPGSWAGVRRAAGAKWKAGDGDRRLGLQRLGREVSAVR